MYYDESSKRRNLLAGLAVGAVLGAGLALLLLPGDGVAGRARFVARSVGHLGRAGRRTQAYVRALHARVEEPADDGGEEEDALDALDTPDASGDYDGGDYDDGGEPDRPAPVRRMARRRFTL